MIGVLIGVVLALQVRTNPVKIGSFPLDQIEVQKSLLSTFSVEQEQLKGNLSDIEIRLAESKQILENRTSRQILDLLQRLRNFSGFSNVSGAGLQIILNDNPDVSRLDFSDTNEYFVQASDLRDVVNSLFLNDAAAVSVNGKRISPLTSIKSVFDTILVGNFQIGSPFIVQAVGNPEQLESALDSLKHRKIRLLFNYSEKIIIPPAQGIPSTNFLSLIQNETSARHN